MFQRRTSHCTRTTRNVSGYPAPSSLPPTPRSWPCRAEMRHNCRRQSKPRLLSRFEPVWSRVSLQAAVESPAGRCRDKPPTFLQPVGVRGQGGGRCERGPTLATATMQAAAGSMQYFANHDFWPQILQYRICGRCLPAAFARTHRRCCGS